MPTLVFNLNSVLAFSQDDRWVFLLKKRKLNLSNRVYRWGRRGERVGGGKEQNTRVHTKSHTDMHILCIPLESSFSVTDLQQGSRCTVSAAWGWSADSVIRQIGLFVWWRSDTKILSLDFNKGKQSSVQPLGSDDRLIIMRFTSLFALQFWCGWEQYSTALFILWFFKGRFVLYSQNTEREIIKQNYMIHTEN